MIIVFKNNGVIKNRYEYENNVWVCKTDLIHKLYYTQKANGGSEEYDSMEIHSFLSDVLKIVLTIERCNNKYYKYSNFNSIDKMIKFINEKLNDYKIPFYIEEEGNRIHKVWKVSIYSGYVNYINTGSYVQNCCMNFSHTILEDFLKYYINRDLNKKNLYWFGCTLNRLYLRTKMLHFTIEDYKLTIYNISNILYNFNNYKNEYKLEEYESGRAFKYRIIKNN